MVTYTVIYAAYRLFIIMRRGKDLGMEILYSWSKPFSLLNPRRGIGINFLLGKCRFISLINLFPDSNVAG